MDLGSRIQDPGSGKNLFRIPDPGSRGQKAPNPGSGSATLGSGIGKKIRIRIRYLDPGRTTRIISESLEAIFWVKILKFFDADPGWKNSDLG